VVNGLPWDICEPILLLQNQDARLDCWTKRSICWPAPAAAWGPSTVRANDSWRIASKSKPGEFNEVTVLDGVARCSCTGFQFRGNCSHAQQVAAQVAAGTLA
jgi:hypothetical protein